ncbi:MAG: hypothetical protein Q9162_000542 [Coniocarpon cinnabarinum]
MAKFAIRRVSTKEELDQLTEVIWESFYHPYQAIYNIFHPLLGYTETEHRRSIKADQDRRWTKHASSPASNWLYATDANTGRIIGGAQWVVYTESPPSAAPTERPEAEQWPEGPYRDFANEFLRQYHAPKQQLMQGPHAGETFQTPA